MKIWYEVDNSGVLCYEQENYILDIDDSEQLEWIAQECADDYYDNHDGWESRWPVTLSILHSEDGPVIETFNVELDFTPMFSASRTA